MYSRLNPAPPPIPSNVKKLHGISLSTGYGGLDKALLEGIPNLEFAAVCDIEIFPIANLISKMEKGLMPVAPVWTDITTFPYKEFNGLIDLLCAGFPCQPFSGATKNRQSTDSFKYLWEHIARGIHELGNPSIVFFENVRNMLNEKLRSDIKSTLPGIIEDSYEGMNVTHHIVSSLQELGYKVEVGLFDAREVDCVTPRPRTFILGVREDCPKYVVDSLMTSPCVVGEEGNFESSIEAIVSETDNILSWASVDYPESIHTDDLLAAQFDSLIQKDPKLKLAAPAPFEEPQYPWEPPRLIEIGKISQYSWDSLKDEARMIGNGVIPQEAYHAFCVLFNQLLGR